MLTKLLTKGAAKQATLPEGQQRLLAGHSDVKVRRTWAQRGDGNVDLVRRRLKAEDDTTVLFELLRNDQAGLLHDSDVEPFRTHRGSRVRAAALWHPTTSDEEAAVAYDELSVSYLRSAAKFALEDASGAQLLNRQQTLSVLLDRVKWDHRADELLALAHSENLEQDALERVRRESQTDQGAARRLLHSGAVATSHDGPLLTFTKQHVGNLDTHPQLLGRMKAWLDQQPALARRYTETTDEHVERMALYRARQQAAQYVRQPDRIAALVDATNRRYDDELAEVLRTNPFLTDDHRVALLAATPWKAAEKWGKSLRNSPWPKRLELLTLLGKASEQGRTNLYYMLPPLLPAEITSAQLQQATEALGSYATRYIASHPACTMQMARNLPAVDVARSHRRPDEVAQWLADQLDSDGFDIADMMLDNGFNGTLQQLVDAVNSAQTPADAAA